ncbi:MAG TPA: flippase activity-associated protein Agl23 [Ktedonobacteraceae bacterium]|nr:flippase activity-associated protein Agl23 [Ktedonobacteraceae bacterium]
MKSEKDRLETVVNMTDRTGEKESKSEEKTAVSLPVDEMAVSLEEISEVPENAPAKRRFWRTGSRPSREQVLTACAFWGVILLGAILRFWGLGDKPLHHDESLHAYFGLQFLHNTIEQWAICLSPDACYHYDPLLHGPFQFHAIAIVYLIAQILGAPDHGVNTTTVRIVAALLGIVIVALPYFLRHYLGKVGAWLACFLLAVSPSMVYFSRFAREDIYMACFTLLLVVASAQYMRTRRIFWFITAAVAFSLSYATKEATFLTIGVFGSFLGALIAWELGSCRSFPLHFRSKQLATNDEGAHQAEVESRGKFVPRTAAPVTLLLYFVVAGALAKLLFGWLKNLSIYITDPRNTKQADAFVAQLKQNTQLVVPWLGILLAVIVMIVLFRERGEEVEPEERRGLARWVDPEKQPWLDTIVTMPWQHLFFGFVIAWIIFIVLFTALFTKIPSGIGDGIWQGLYYWIQQQQVARGGQPWYYYFMLIPLYDQIGLVFGFVGIVYSLRHPSRFRLFLVYWFVGNLLIYSWAAEKMPWLMIHMTMPLMLLAAIGLQPIVLTLTDAIKRVRTLSRAKAPDPRPDLSGERVGTRFIASVRPRFIASAPRFVASILGAIVAVFTLLLTLQNMYQVVYIHPADAPHEMMIYVQTTTDVNTIMAKVDQLDQQLYGGKHLLPIAVMNDATWPFAWYLRDYNGACYSFPSKQCPATANWPIIIAGGDNLPSVQEQYSPKYAYHKYEMRSQWDQGYMPPPCISTLANPCGPQQYTGVGAFPWLSYGNNPPHPGQFNLGLIAKNVWQWWWHRTPFGGIDDGYGMALLIRKDISVHTHVRP